MQRFNRHPRIYRFSLVLPIINLATLLLCLWEENKPGAGLNFLLFVFNGLWAIGNYKLREYRRDQQREDLIRLTLGD